MGRVVDNAWDSETLVRLVRFGQNHDLLQLQLLQFYSNDTIVAVRNHGNITYCIEMFSPNTKRNVSSKLLSRTSFTGLKIVSNIHPIFEVRHTRHLLLCMASCRSTLASTNTLNLTYTTMVSTGSSMTIGMLALCLLWSSSMILSVQGFAASSSSSPSTRYMPDTTNLVEEALKISATFGLDSKEAAVAWDAVEEIESSGDKK
jgi:CP12 domain